MKNYLIIVEGAHDIAVIQKLLILNGVNHLIQNKAELPEIWVRQIPNRFPFDGGRLDRITPIPSFLKNDEISVAIKAAKNDMDIMKVLQQILDIMTVEEKDQINGIMIVCDADQDTADKKLERLKNRFSAKDDCKLEEDSGHWQLNVLIKSIPIYTYVFPDNEHNGNLENLLLETAAIVYPELLCLAKKYVGEASTINYSALTREQDRKKATVGCIGNVMKPGKANQISISDNAWISKQTLQECNMLMKLDAVLKKMINA